MNGMTRWTCVAACMAVLFWSGLIPDVAAAEATNAPLLTVPRIFDSDEFNGEGFSARWLKDGSGYTTFEKSKAPGGGSDLVRHDPKTGETQVLVPARDFSPTADSGPLSVEDHAWSEDGSRLLLFTQSKRVWRTHSRGDYWVLDRSSHELVKLGGDAPPSSLMFAKFSPDATRVAYVRDRNLYVQDLRTLRITALTTDTSPHLINGTFDWVYEEEFYLRDGFRWSPDGGSIAFWQLNTEGVREVPLINNTEGLYPKAQWIQYPKTGEQNAACRIGVVDVGQANPVIRWMKVPGDPRQHYLFDLAWPEGSPGLVIQQLNRLQNTNRVFLASPTNGEVSSFLMDRDEAWVDAHQELKWFKDGKRFLFWSQRDGWRHVFLADSQHGPLKCVTPGDYDVTGIAHLDEAGRWLYFMASPKNPTQRALHRIRLDGHQHEVISPADQPGTHSYQISPDGRWAIHTVSRFMEPPVTDVISLPDHKRVRLLKGNEKLKERLAALKLPKTEFFRVTVAKDVEIDGWCILPPDLDPGQKYPLLVHVYGEPAGSTVKDAWGGKSQLWHMMLAQQGYVVMSFDNRGTDTPRGRAWAKSIYRQVGVLASQDQAEAVRQVLKSRPYLDPARVGIWGWSGGGSMTLNALFRHPDLYKAGISIASVPNMRLYDTIYQERYMGLPADNADGYRNGSPLTFASQLKGELLLIHGTGDDNCHYQGFEALVDELIRNRKQFRIMSYPNRSHSISEGVGTSLHLRELMTQFLHEKLPVGKGRSAP